MKKNFFEKFILVMIMAAMTIFGVSCRKDNSLKKEIILCCYGANVKESIPYTLGAIESSLQKAYPKYKIDMCFTAEHIINYLKEHDNYIVKNVKQTLDEAVENGIEEVIVLPVYFLNGVVLESVIKKGAMGFFSFDISPSLKNCLLRIILWLLTGILKKLRMLL